jgi:hypothetical protein
MFEHLGYKVIKLDRVLFANLTKKNVNRGKWRMLNEKEVRILKFMNNSFVKKVKSEEEAVALENPSKKEFTTSKKAAPKRVTSNPRAKVEATTKREFKPKTPTSTFKKQSEKPALKTAKPRRNFNK